VVSQMVCALRGRRVWARLNFWQPRHHPTHGLPLGCTVSLGRSEGMERVFGLGTGHHTTYHLTRLPNTVTNS
jgi:hypothetical protein